MTERIAVDITRNLFIIRNKLRLKLPHMVHVVSYLFVMRNKLCLDVSCDHVNPAQHLSCFQTPYGTCGINAGRAEKVGIYLVPIERCEGCAEVRILILEQETVNQNWLINVIRY